MHAYRRPINKEINSVLLTLTNPFPNKQRFDVKGEKISKPSVAYRPNTYIHIYAYTAYTYC